MLKIDYSQSNFTYSPLSVAEKIKFSFALLVVLLVLVALVVGYFYLASSINELTLFFYTTLGFGIFILPNVLILIGVLQFKSKKSTRIFRYGIDIIKLLQVIALCMVIMNIIILVINPDIAQRTIGAEMVTQIQLLLVIAVLWLFHEFMICRPILLHREWVVKNGLYSSQAIGTNDALTPADTTNDSYTHEEQISKWQELYALKIISKREFNRIREDIRRSF